MFRVFVRKYSREQSCGRDGKEAKSNREKTELCCNIYKRLAKLTGYSSTVVAFRVVLSWEKGLVSVDHFLDIEDGYWTEVSTQMRHFYSGKISEQHVQLRVVFLKHFQ